MSNSRKSGSTLDSEEAVKEKHRRMLSPEEVSKWFEIHDDIVVKAHEKVTTAKQSRFMGFFSPQRLILKANLVRDQNAMKVTLAPPTRLCPLNSVSIQERVLSPVFKNRRLMEDNSSKLNRNILSRETTIDRSKAKIKDVLTMLCNKKFL